MFDSYPIFVQILSFLPFVVYPVGMTTYWCYFFANIFASVYCILTKLGTKMRPYTTFLCTKFQGNQVICFHNFNAFTKRRKNEETRPIFGSSYLGNTWCDLVEIWNVGYWRWRASPHQKPSGFMQAARSYVCAKIALLLFLSIYSWARRAGFWVTRHTTMCLDYSTYYSWFVAK